MIIKCKMCGGNLSFEEGSTVCECEYCGSRQTLPNIDNEKKGNLFNRANRLRMNSEFDKASAVYESIVAEFPEEAEAYWGLCLCAYGIEYVDDPATGKKMPTCHRTMTTSIMEDENFEQACDNADSIARKVYRDEAKAIDRIQKDILAIAASEAPYDVFICYKETDENGDRTEDSVLAQDIYDALTMKGLKVFFSRITLEDKLGVQYEPYIYAALSSAKVMIAVGTQFEYYDAVWVKNEWSRFLHMMKADKTKSLIPSFKDLDAYDMPKEFKGLQAQDMGKLGWLQDLTRGIEKLCGKGGATIVHQTVDNANPQSSAVENLMKRVYLFLEDTDFVQASEYINKVLDIDAEYAPAYVARVLVKLKLKSENDFMKIDTEFSSDVDWKKALRFATEEQRKRYMSYMEVVRLKTVVMEAVYAVKHATEKENELLRQRDGHKRFIRDVEREITETNADIEKAGGFFGSAKKKRLQEKLEHLTSDGKKLQDELEYIETEISNALNSIEVAKKSQKESENDLTSLLESLKVSDEEINRVIQKYRQRIKDLKQYDKGKKVRLGVYDGEPIEWLVIDSKEYTRTMISVKCLDTVSFNDANANDNKWEISSIREWLNNTFYNKAFNEEAKKLIISGPTEDCVWLLSADEAKNYFKQDSERACLAGKIAMKHGAYVDDSAKCLWWLRTPGVHEDSAAAVSIIGEVYELGYRMSRTDVCVRPVICINLC